MSKRSLHCPDCGAGVSPEALRCEYCHAFLNMTACPSCFGALFQGMRYCPGCGTAVARTEVESPKERICPRCEAVLSTAEIGGTRIRECGSCGGLWLDTTSFRRICDDRERQETAAVFLDVSGRTARSASEPLSGRFYIPCPECGDLMNRKNFAACSGVIVDVCRTHGVWFDRNELRDILAFIREGGLHKAREIERADLQAERDRVKPLRHDALPALAGLAESAPLDELRKDGSLLDSILSLCRILF